MAVAKSLQSTRTVTDADDDADDDAENDDDDKDGGSTVKMRKTDSVCENLWRD